MHSVKSRIKSSPFQWWQAAEKEHLISQARADPSQKIFFLWQLFASSHEELLFLPVCLIRALFVFKMSSTVWIKWREPWKRFDLTYSLLGVDVHCNACNGFVNYAVHEQHISMHYLVENLRRETHFCQGYQLVITEILSWKLFKHWVLTTCLWHNEQTQLTLCSSPKCVCGCVCVCLGECHGGLQLRQFECITRRHKSERFSHSVSKMLMPSQSPGIFWHQSATQQGLVASHLLMGLKYFTVSVSLEHLHGKH